MTIRTAATAALAMLASGTDAQTGSTAPRQGVVTYRGTWAVESQRAAPPNRRFTLGQLLQPKQHDEGAVTIVVSYDEEAVRANISGTGGMQTFTLTGLVRNGQCRLTGPSRQVWEGACGAGGFTGTIRNTPDNRRIFSGTFQTRAIEQQAATRVTTAAAGAAAPPPPPPPVRTGDSRTDSLAFFPHTNMSRCWAMTLRAPTTEAELHAMPTTKLLLAVSTMAAGNDSYCAGVYAAEAASRNDVQGMAMFSYSFDAGGRNAGTAWQAYWCQAAMRQWRTTRVEHERDAISYFCPAQQIVPMMTAAEKRTYQASLQRAYAQAGANRAEMQEKTRTFLSLLQQGGSDGSPPPDGCGLVAVGTNAAGGAVYGARCQ